MKKNKLLISQNAQPYHWYNTNYQIIIVLNTCLYKREQCMYIIATQKPRVMLEWYWNRNMLGNIILGSIKHRNDAGEVLASSMYTQIKMGRIWCFSDAGMVLVIWFRYDAGSHWYWKSNQNRRMIPACILSKFLKICWMMLASYQNFLWGV